MIDQLARLQEAMADRYTLERELGQGGMATVYLAHDLKHDRDVALKVLRPELTAILGRERFLAEIRLTAQLDHPHILTLLDSGESESFVWYTLPFIRGESLRQKLTRERQLAVEDALTITAQIAGALEHAHQRGIIHRDVKPENILLHEGEAMLADFGIALAVKEAGGQRLTETGLSVGTPQYMSPEQAAAERQLDARSDVYSLGAVLYEMLAGEPPFTGVTAQAVIAKLMVQEAMPLRIVRKTIPAGLEAAVAQALAKTPADRPPSAAAFAKALTGPAEAPAPPEQSIVVLPFENLSPDPENAFFADGLTEELIADLSQVRALRVISRTSAMLLKGAKKDVPTIARDLNVRYVLEGSVRRAGNGLRITAQLIDAATDKHMWAEKYAGALEDVFDLQERLSRRIVEALKVTLAPDEDRHLASRDIPDVEAFALYLRARQELLKMTEAAFDLAEQLVERALARTGPNALLLATAAVIEFSRHDIGIRSTVETLDRADALATRALELAPDLVDAHVARGLVAWRRFDAPASVRLVRRAVALDPGNAMAAWAAGYILAEVGRTVEGREHGDRARALDPLWWPAQIGSCFADLYEGRFDSALAKMVAMHAISRENPAANLFLGVCLLYAGRPDEAGAAFGRLAAAGAGFFSAFGTFLGAWATEDRGAMRAVLAERGTREAAEIDKELSWVAAAAFASVGDSDEALRWLSRTIEMGFINHRFFAGHDPFLATLRGDPRFESLMERAREKQREIEG